MKTEWGVSSERFLEVARGKNRWVRQVSVYLTEQSAHLKAEWINESPGMARGRNAYIVTREVSEWVST